MSTRRCCPNGSETVKSYPAGTTIACPRAEEFAHAHHGTHTHYDPATDSFTVVRPLPAPVLCAS